MNRTSSTRARRAASGASTANGTVGVAAPAAPVAPNARESIKTGEHATTAAAAGTTSSTRTGDGVIVRAILSTLGADTAAALVALLVQWLRAVLSAGAAERRTVEASTDDVTARAGELGAGDHARAIVAALVGQSPDGAAAAYCAGDPSMAAMLRAALDTLSDVAPAGQGGAPDALRMRAARLVARIAADNSHGAAGIAAAHMLCDDGGSAQHTACVALEAVEVCARLVAETAEQNLNSTDPDKPDGAARTVAAMVYEQTAPMVEALNAARDVLAALATGGAS